MSVAHESSISDMERSSAERTSALTLIPRRKVSDQIGASPLRSVFRIDG